MARGPTTYSKISTGYVDSGNTIAESNYDFSCIDGYAETLTVNAGVAGDLTGAVTGTTGTFSTSLGVGGGTTITSIHAVAEILDFGNLGVSGGVSTLTAAVSGATYSDAFMVTTPSIWSGLDDLVIVTARSGDTTGEVDIIAVNSGLSARDCTAGSFIITRIGF